MLIATRIALFTDSGKNNVELKENKDMNRHTEFVVVHIVQLISSLNLRDCPPLSSTLFKKESLITNDVEHFHYVLFSLHPERSLFLRKNNTMNE